MKTIPNNTATLALVVLLTASCSSLRRASTELSTAAAGAAAGALLSDNEPKAIAAGAGLGWLGGKALNAATDSEIVAAAEEAYHKGRSDAAKQHYWSLQALHERNGDEELGSLTSYDLTIPAQTDEHEVRRVATQVSLPVVE